LQEKKKRKRGVEKYQKRTRQGGNEWLSLQQNKKQIFRNRRGGPLKKIFRKNKEKQMTGQSEEGRTDVGVGQVVSLGTSNGKRWSGRGGGGNKKGHAGKGGTLRRRQQLKCESE